jgi:hypothetical protein
MKIITFRQLQGICLAVFLLAGLTGCASVKPDPGEVISRHAGDFNSGTAAAKNIWDSLVAAVNARDYPAALSILEQIRGLEGLTPGQLAAINQAEEAVRKQVPAAGQP